MKRLFSRLMVGILSMLLIVAFPGAISVNAASSAVYVSPSGTSGSPGTLSSPTTLYSAVTMVSSGGTIYMLPGTYRYTDQVTIERGNNGSSGSFKTIRPYENGSVILDFSSQAYQNPKGLVCSDDDFVTLTPSVTRGSDGMIRLGNFLKLKSGSDLVGSGYPRGSNIGADLS